MGANTVVGRRSILTGAIALAFVQRAQTVPGEDDPASVRPKEGDLLVKVFQGAGFDELLKSARRRYGRVMLKKPKASRSRSPEIYMLARQFGVV